MSAKVNVVVHPHQHQQASTEEGTANLRNRRVKLSLRMVHPLALHQLRMVPSRATHHRVNTNLSSLPTRDRRVGMANSSHKGMVPLDLATNMVDNRHAIDGNVTS